MAALHLGSACLAVLLCLDAAAAKSGRSYSIGQTVQVYAGKAGPFSNPSETYWYSALPLCGVQEGGKEKLLRLGEVLEGHRLMTAPYEIPFRRDFQSHVACTRRLTHLELEALRLAVQQDYYVNFLFDDELPVWAFVGKVEPSFGPGGDRLKLYQHFHFDFLYSEDRLIQVDVSANPLSTLDISDDSSAEGEDMTFTYSAAWKSTDIPYAQRLDKYSLYSFLPQHLEVHWFAVVNSIVTVGLLTVFLIATLSRFISADLARYTGRGGGEEEGLMEEEEATGWKLVSGDVFRPPPHSWLFTACVGSGAQMLAVMVIIFALALLGNYKPYNRGNLLTTCVVLYVLTSGLAGYVSGRQYSMLGGDKWTLNCGVLMLLFIGPLLLVFSILNSIAWAWGSTAALPLGTILLLVGIWAMAILPFTLAGAVLGKSTGGDFAAPVRVTKYVREVPPLPWYRAAGPQILAAGFLPFSAIYIELYYIFASVWGHKVYVLWTILLIVFAILLVVTAFLNIAFTYFQLAAEDHRWWWRSFLCGASSGAYVMLYSVYYYLRSDMHGLMQTCFFFGWTTIACWALSLMLGAVGWATSMAFCRHIYSRVKAD